MHDDDERHPAIGGHVSKKIFQGLQAACRRAQANHGKDVVGWEIGRTFMSEFWLPFSAIQFRQGRPQELL